MITTARTSLIQSGRGTELKSSESPVNPPLGKEIDTGEVERVVSVCSQINLRMKQTNSSHEAVTPQGITVTKNEGATRLVT